MILCNQGTLGMDFFKLGAWILNLYVVIVTDREERRGVHRVCNRCDTHAVQKV